jgi:starch synthase
MVLPAYGSILHKVKVDRSAPIATTHHYGQDISILETTLPDTQVKVWLVDCPTAFERMGNPYLDEHGAEWADNAFRFALFCQVAVDMALNRLGLDWPVDVVHCNDWQTGLVPALLSTFDARPASVFTIHNLAYQGLFDPQEFFDLGLPDQLWSMHGLEYYGLFSFLKGGLVYADYINTVSPQYAHEIQTEEFGYGLQDLLLHRGDRLSGILNGIDSELWNPQKDPFLLQHYSVDQLDKKLVNKSKLQAILKLPQDSEKPLIGLVSRLVEQKGLDLIIEPLPVLLAMPLQMIFLGTGEEYYQQQLSDFAKRYPDNLSVYIGYDEALSHEIEAGCDLYLMPSLFEPCGLNQLYSLAYGTLPIVTAVGGLVDSVVGYGDSLEATPDANGFILEQKTAQSLVATVRQAIDVYADKKAWSMMQINAMTSDFSWAKSADAYLELYQQAIY